MVVMTMMMMMMMNETRMISINPLIVNEECRRAIIDDLNINKDLMLKISKKSSQCREFNGIYTREGIDAFNLSQCSWKGNLIRSHDIVIQNLIDNDGKIKMTII